jgi:hypothetical protein
LVPDLGIEAISRPEVVIEHGRGNQSLLTSSIQVGLLACVVVVFIPKILHNQIVHVLSFRNLSAMCIIIKASADCGPKFFLWRG